MSYCFVIPNYNHDKKIKAIIEQLLAYDYDIVIVDDASNQGTKAVLTELELAYPQVKLVTHLHNQGKGGAVISGILKAAKLGASHAIQLDADGQHNLDDIQRLISMSQQQPEAVISGKPVYDKSVPKGRLYSRYITHFWVWVETLSFAIKDSMCGFRVYPVKACCQLFQQQKLGTRMDFDIEILVRLYWRKVAIKFIDTWVIYPEDGVSHFRPFKDNCAISWLHTRLFFGMLIRSPILLARKLSG